MATTKPAQKPRPQSRPQSQPQQPQKQTTWVKHHKKRNYAITGIICAALIGIIVFASLPHPTVKVGQQAPDFTLQDIGPNGTFHLAAEKGNPIFLEFMRTSCEYCQQQAPLLTQLYNNYSNRVLFVSITIDPYNDQPSTLSAFAQAHGQMMSTGMGWHWLRDDTSNAVTNMYGINGTPTMFMIDRNGTVQVRYDGFKDMPTLKQALQTIL